MSSKKNQGKKIVVVPVREGFNMVDGSLQMLPVGLDAGIDEMSALELPTVPTLIEVQVDTPVVVVAEAEVVQPEAEAKPEEIVVDPIAAQLAALHALAAGTGFEGLVNDIGLYLSLHVGITTSAVELIATETDPKKLHDLFVKPAEALKEINTRIRNTFSDRTKECIGVTNSVADRAVKRRRTLFEVKAATPKEAVPAPSK